MLLTLVAWTYVVVLMAVAEATSPQGTLLGALATLLLYGALPMSIVAYLLYTPARRRARAAARAPLTTEPAPLLPASAVASAPPNDGDHAASDSVAPVRKKP